MPENERIDELLERTSDPVQRAIVIVLGNINRDLIAQTGATNALAKVVESTNAGMRQIDSKLTQHVADENVMLAVIQGSARVALWLAPSICLVVLGLGGYVWALQTSSINAVAAKLGTVDDAVQIIRQKQLVIDERVSSLERRQAADEARQGR